MNTDEVKWCCAGFRAQVLSAGSRGFGIFVDDTAEPVLFTLQHRSLEPDTPKPDHPQGPLALVSEYWHSLLPLVWKKPQQALP